MKKFIVLVLLIGLIGGAIFFVPKAINWNNYEQKITAFFEKKTGRKLQIRGSVNFSLVPQPMFIIENVSLSNEPGFSFDAFADIERMEIKIDPMSLLKDDITITEIVMNKPNFYLEKNTLNRVNWVFPFLKDTYSFSTVNRSEKATTISVNSGTVTYKRNMDISSYENLNLNITAQNSYGPFDISGTFSQGENNFSINMNVNQILLDTPINLNISLGHKNGGGVFSFSGTMNSLTDRSTIAGNVSLDTSSMKGFAKLLLNRDIPDTYDKPLVASLSMLSNDNEVSLTNGAFKYGDDSATVSLHAMLQDNYIKSLKGSISIVSFDTTPFINYVRSLQMKQLASTLEVDLSFNASVIKFRDEQFSNVTGKIANSSESKIAGDLSFDYMGNNKVRTSLNIILDDPISFEGSVHFNASEFQNIAKRILGDTATPKPNALKTAEINGSLTGNMKKFSLSKISGNISGIETSMNILADRTQEMPSIAIEGKLSSVNLNNHLSFNDQTEKDTSPPRDKITRELQRISALGNVKTDIKLAADFINFKTFPYHNLKLDLSTSPSGLAIRQISGDIGGIQTDLSLELENLENPIIKKAEYSFYIDNPSFSKLNEILGFFNINPPLDYRTMANIGMKGRLTGNFDELNIDNELKTNTGLLMMQGKINTVSNTFSGNIEARHNNLKQLIRSLGYDYQPKGNLGVSKLTGTFNGRMDAFILEDMEMSVGLERIKGTVKLEQPRGRKKISAEVATPNITLSDFLPEINLELLPKENKTAMPDWDKKIISIGILKDIDSDIMLSFNALAFNDRKLEKGTARLIAEQKKVTLAMNKLKAGGGNINFVSNLDMSQTVPAFSISGKMLNVGLKGPLFRASFLDIKETTIKNSTFSFKAEGATLEQMLLSLQGDMTYELTNTVISGMNFNEIDNLFDRIINKKTAIPENQIIATVNNSLRSGNSDIQTLSGKISATQGIIKTATRDFTTVHGIGAFSSTVNLKEWTVSSEIRLKMMNDNNLIISNKAEGDMGDVKISTSADEIKEHLIRLTSSNIKDARQVQNRIGEEMTELINTVPPMINSMKAYEQETKLIVGQEASLAGFHDEIIKNSRAISAEIKSMSEIYKKEEKSEADLQKLKTSFANIEKYVKSSESSLKAAIIAKTKIRVENAWKVITEAEKVARNNSDTNPNPLLKKIHEEIKQALDTTNTAREYLNTLNDASKAPAIEEKIMDLKERVEYLAGQLRN